MRFDAAGSFANLVGIPSTEVPELDRVEPGDPDNSYVVQKIEGTQAVGAQMPLGGPPLPQEQMELVRQWITDGALPDGAVIQTALALAPKVSSASIEQDALLSVAPDSLSIVWTSPVDNTTLTDATVSLVRSGDTGDAADDTAIDVSVVDGDNPYVTTLLFDDQALTGGEYQLYIVGEGDIYARGSDAAAIDGDGNGTAGGNFVLDFSVE